jgi:large subunit ribosomal protein L28e
LISSHHNNIFSTSTPNNYFLIKQFGNSNAKVQFSTEPNNLYNVHSCNYSGLANNKTDDCGPLPNQDKRSPKRKKQNKPAAFSHKTVMCKEFRKMANAVKNQVSGSYYRHDLTKPALARLTAVYPSIQIAELGVKKKTCSKHDKTSNESQS